MLTCDCGHICPSAGPMKRHQQRCWTPRTLERLLELCGVKETPLDGSCWIATKGLNPLGYPRIKFPGRERMRASHAIILYVTGELPTSGTVVMHSCDMPSCLNPFHLIVGTQSQNMKDMWEKGRGVLHLENLGRWK